MNATLILVITLAIAAANSSAQSPYTGQELRAIKSLSTEEIESLGRGDGMGFAKAAELNSYPGPKHVLELADKLDLSAEQHMRTTRLFAAMKDDAIDLGNRLIAAEAALDRMFAVGTVDDLSLEAQLIAIGKLRAQLRYVHLEAHVQQRAILDEHQVARYERLRGYGNEHGNHH